MGRKPRIEFPGAIYHVINRGNYRHAVFETDGAKRSFLNAMLEAAEHFRWELYAYALMTNHFHLAIKTIDANLSQGMHWLQGTFACRFNRFRSEQGHLFQNRYRAVLVQEGAPLLAVVNYIHLNPLKAGLVSLNELAAYPWCSLAGFAKGPRLPFMSCEPWLRELGLADRLAGWTSYLQYLAWLSSEENEQRKQAFGTLLEGLTHGADDWREQVLATTPSLVRSDPALRELHWTKTLAQLLAQRGIETGAARATIKGAGWKIEIARQMRLLTTATIPWIAQTLHMGSPASVRVYLSRK